MLRKVLDIHSKSHYPVGDLSNFASHRFIIDGVKCESMEGFLQSLKFTDTKMQIIVCGMIGCTAKEAGQNENWQESGTLWWKGEAIDRYGIEYQQLLDKAYWSLSKNQAFIDALMATGFAKLVHSIGKTEMTDTILTVNEFCGRLMRIRRKLRIPYIFVLLKRKLAMTFR